MFLSVILTSIFYFWLKSCKAVCCIKITLTNKEYFDSNIQIAVVYTVFYFEIQFRIIFEWYEKLVEEISWMIDKWKIFVLDHPVVCIFVFNIYLPSVTTKEV